MSLEINLKAKSRLAFISRLICSSMKWNNHFEFWSFRRAAAAAETGVAEVAEERRRSPKERRSACFDYSLFEDDTSSCFISLSFGADYSHAAIKPQLGFPAIPSATLLSIIFVFVSPVGNDCDHNTAELDLVQPIPTLG